MLDTNKYMTVTGMISKPGAIEKCVVIAVSFIALTLVLAGWATSYTSSKDRIGITKEHTTRVVAQASP